MKFVLLYEEDLIIHADSDYFLEKKHRSNAMPYESKNSLVLKREPFQMTAEEESFLLKVIPVFGSFTGSCNSKCLMRIDDLRV